MSIWRLVCKFLHLSFRASSAPEIRDGKHVHEFNLKDVSDGFNTSHIIHRLEWPSRCDTAVYIWPTITAERMMAAVSNNGIQREYLSHRFGQRVPGVESPLEAPELHATQKFRLSFRCSSASVVT